MRPSYAAQKPSLVLAAGGAKLVAVVRELSHARSLDDITKIVRSAARDLTGSDGATFVLKDKGFCFYADEDAVGPLWKGQRFPLEACISGWAMLNKKPAVIPDIYADPRIPHEAYRPTFVKSLVMVPIRAEDPIGAIGNYWADRHQPTEEQVELMQALADTTAVAMENVKLYESLEEKVRDLNSANLAKDQLLMTVSHELRTPLTAIQGWAQILSEPGLEKSEVILGANTIERQARAQGRIIDDLLSTSEILLGRLPLDREIVDFVAASKASFERFRTAASGKGIDFLFESGIERGFVRGDPVRIEQIFGNLLSNAVKFTPSGGRVTVLLQKRGPHLAFEVRDNGEGISSEALPRIFEKFQQGDNSITRRHGGMGLGLTIAKALTEAQDGTIHADSDGPQKGAVFSVSFPEVAPPENVPH